LCQDKRKVLNTNEMIKGMTFAQKRFDQNQGSSADREVPLFPPFF